MGYKKTERHTNEKKGHPHSEEGTKMFKLLQKSKDTSKQGQLQLRMKRKELSKHSVLRSSFETSDLSLASFFLHFSHHSPLL